jgi:hypothetical protein
MWANFFMLNLVLIQWSWFCLYTYEIMRNFSFFVIHGAEAIIRQLALIKHIAIQDQRIFLPTTISTHLRQGSNGLTLYQKTGKINYGRRYFSSRPTNHKNILLQVLNNTSPLVHWSVHLLLPSSLCNYNCGEIFFNIII